LSARTFAVLEVQVFGEGPFDVGARGRNLALVETLVHGVEHRHQKQHDEESDAGEIERACGRLLGCELGVRRRHEGAEKFFREILESDRFLLGAWCVRHDVFSSAFPGAGLGHDAITAPLDGKRKARTLTRRRTLG